MLTATLTLAGGQTVVHNANIDASNAAATQQQNLAIDVNPTNPLHVSGVSEQNFPTVGASLGVYRSLDGGVTWTTTAINNNDGKSVAATRSDPSLAYDADGNLYISYIVDDGVTSFLMVATSTDDGASFALFTEVFSITDSPTESLVGTSLGTGPDGLGGQAAYVVTTLNTGLGNVIAVFGSNDGGATFTGGTGVSDNPADDFSYGDPSVGPSGQLYVSWFDIPDSAVRFDRDLDGLFAGVSNFGADITVVDNTIARPSVSGTFNLVSGQLVPAAPNHGVSTRAGARYRPQRLGHRWQPIHFFHGRIQRHRHRHLPRPLGITKEPPGH